MYTGNSRSLWNFGIEQLDLLENNIKIEKKNWKTQQTSLTKSVGTVYYLEEFRR